MLCLVAFCAVTGCGRKNRRAENAASLEDLNRALPAIEMRLGNFPPSSNDLARFLALSGKTMPIPPAGKKLGMDPASHQFVFVNQ
jgi:hypothetical protein